MSSSLDAGAQGVEMTSESYTLVAPTLSGGGGIDLESTDSEPTVSALGVTIGQPSPVGVSTGPESGIQLRSGFWQVVASDSGASDIDSDGDGIFDAEDNCPIHPNPGQEESAPGIGAVCACSGPATLIGDASMDGRVNADDYALWADNFGESGGVGYAEGDFDCDNTVSSADYTLWSDHYGEALP